MMTCSTVTLTLLTARSPFISIQNVTRNKKKYFSFISTSQREKNYFVIMPYKPISASCFHTRIRLDNLCIPRWNKYKHLHGCGSSPGVEAIMKPSTRSSITTSAARFLLQNHAPTSYVPIRTTLPTTGYRNFHIDSSKSNRGSQDRGCVYHAPLSVLPLGTIVRSLAISTVSSSRLLLPISLRILNVLANTESRLLDPDRSPLLRLLLDKTLYAQFCAGACASDIRKTTNGMKDIGFSGVILAYAKDSALQMPPLGTNDADVCLDEKESDMINDISPWAEATMKTVEFLQPGDFTALKFTGAGRLARDLLARRMPPGPLLSNKIDEICKLARKRCVRLIIDGEEHAMQPGIDDWTLQFAKLYNKTPGAALLLGTYQAYKKMTGKVLELHLAEAQKHNFTLGIKLVRGAYMHSDPRHVIFSEKADTDAYYDGLSASILTREWSDMIRGSGDFPNVSLMLATHNADSVRRAYNMLAQGRVKSELVFAQLQGMADEISCELVQINRDIQARIDDGSDTERASPFLPVYKYCAWGTTKECMKYLLRRAEENRDAVERTVADRDAMYVELKRRIKRAFARG